MNMPDLPWEGGCRCGKVRFRITKPPMMTAVCHCTGCQRMTGGAFSTTIMTPNDGFAVEGGTVIGGMHGDQADHHHCDWCKSWLFTRPARDMGFVNVRATMLDDATWFSPYLETFTSEMLPWAKTPAVKSYAEFPEMSEYEGLLKAFVES